MEWETIKFRSKIRDVLVTLYPNFRIKDDAKVLLENILNRCAFLMSKSTFQVTNGNFIDTITSFLPGELKTFAKKEAKKANTSVQIFKFPFFINQDNNLNISDKDLASKQANIVLEFICLEILESAGKVTISKSRITISPDDIIKAIEGDEELKDLYEELRKIPTGVQINMEEFANLKI